MSDRSTAAEPLAPGIRPPPGPADGTVNQAEGLAHDLRAAGQQEAQRERHTQHLLPDGLLGKHLIDQQRRGFDHAPCPATGAESGVLATERD